MKSDVIFTLGLFLFGILLPGSKGEKNVLVLGGNGFLGSALISKLLEDGQNITLLSRGNEYFNSRKEIDPYVHRITCDRDTYIRKTCKELLHSGKYDVVVDFSAYNDFQMDQMIDILNGRVGLYIFISSDAVYEVCEKNHTGLTKEEDAKVKYKAAFKSQYAIENKYGEQKLACEILLAEQRKQGGFPYIILRLSEAMGPKDTTMRLWFYQIWIKLHQLLNIPVFLPDMYKSRNFSMVYSVDVAQTISSIVSDPKKPSIMDRVFNLAFKEDINLSNLFHKIANFSDQKTLNLNNSNSAGWFNILSVDKGPVNISKAQTDLEWNPTPFDEALKSTISFNEGAMVEKIFAKERETVIAKFIEDVLFYLEFEDDEKFIDALRNTYGESVFEGIELDMDVDPSQPRINFDSTKEKLNTLPHSIQAKNKREKDTCDKNDCPER